MPASLTVRDLVYAKPLRTAAGTIALRRVWLLAIDDGSGLIGLGEAAPLPGFGGETPKECAAALAQVMPALTPTFVASWLDRGKPDAPLGALERQLAATPCARAAVEGALLDLLAQLHGQPLAELLAPSPASWIPVNSLIEAGNGQLAAAMESIAAGYRTLKLKMPADAESAGDLLVSLRRQIGVEIKLRADANGAWTADQAVRFAEKARGAGLEYLEQPLPAADLSGMSALRRRTGFPIAADESVRSAADVGKVGAAQAADVVVLKPMFLGGWRATKQAVQLARSCNLGVVVTTALESAVGRAHATHIAAALGDGPHAHGLATGSLLIEDSTAEPLAMSGGDIAIHARPGLGIGALLLPG